MPFIDSDLGDSYFDLGDSYFDRASERDDAEDIDWEAFDAEIAAELAAQPERDWPHDCRCCGRTYERAQWDLLHFVGYSLGQQYRDCACGSTLTRTMPAPEVA